MRIRYAFLFVLLAAAFGCHRETSSSVHVDSALRKYISPDARAIAGFDLASLRSTAFYQKHKGQLDIPLLNSSAQQIGWDPRKDLSSALLVWDGKELLIAGSGSFNREQLEKRFAGAGGSRSEYDGVEIYSSGSEAFAFPAADLALAASPRTIASALDVAKSGSGGPPAELAAKLRSLPGSAQLWVVSRGGLPFAEAPMRSDVSSALANVAGFVNGTEVGLTVAGGLTLAVRIHCVSEVGARRVNDALRGVIGLGRLSTRDDEPELLRAYDALHVSKDGETVTLTAQLSGDLADALLARALKLQTAVR